MKTVVIYKSKTGFAKKYAEWISEELSADIFDFSKIDINTLTTYDTLIYGGSLYAVGINGIKAIKRNLDKFKDKKIIVFATGASPFRAEVIKEVRDKNFAPFEQKFIEFFYLRGGFDYQKLKPFDKVLMTLLKWKLKLKRKTKLTPDERGMLACYDNPVNFTRKENIAPIIDYVKNVNLEECKQIVEN